MDEETLRLTITVDTGAGRREAKLLDADLDKATRSRTGKIDIKVTGDKQAEVDIAKVARDRTAKIDVDTKDSHEKVVKLDGALKNLVRSNQGAEYLGNIVGLLKIPTAINAISVAAQGVTTLAGGAYALGSALAPLVGLSAALPSGLLAVGQAGGAAALGIADVSAAVKAQNKYFTDFSAQSAKAYNGALASLGPNARNFVLDLRSMRTEFDQLKSIAGEGIFAGVNKALPNLTKNLLPTVRAGLAGSSAAVGSGAAQIGGLLGSTGFNKDLGQVMATNNVAIERLGTSITNLVDGFRHLAVAAQPLVLNLAQLAEKSTATFAAWAKNGRETGDLSKFFDRSVSTLQTLMSTLGSLYEVMKNVGSAATPLGNSLVSGLEQGSKSLADLTGKAENLQKMRGYFNSLKEPISEMVGLLKDLGGVFLNVQSGGNLTSVIQDVRAYIIPVLKEFNSTTSTLFTHELIQTIGSIGKVFADLAQTTSGLVLLVDVIGRLADAADKLLTAVPGLKDLVGIFLTLKTISAIGNFAGAGGLLGKLGGGAGLMGSAAETGSGFVRVLKDTLATARPAGEGITFIAGSTAELTTKASAAQVAMNGFRGVLNSAAGQTTAIAASIVAVGAALEYMGREAGKLRSDYQRDVQNNQFLGDTTQQGSTIQDRIDSLRAQQESNRGRKKYNGLGDGPNIIGQIAWSQHDQSIDAQNRILQQSIDWYEKQRQKIDEATQSLGVNNAAVTSFVAAQAQLGVTFSNTTQLIEAYNAALDTNIDKIAQAALTPAQVQQQTNAATDAITKYNETVANGGLTQAQVTTLQQQAAQAAKSVEQAYHSEQSAVIGLANAQKALTLALQPPKWYEMARGVLTLTQAQQEAQRATEDLNILLGKQTAANNGLKASIQTVTMVQDEFSGKQYGVVRMEANPAVSGQQSALESQRALEDAQNRVQAATIAVAEAEKGLYDLRIKGTELDPAVIAARQGVADAEWAVKQAHDATTEALKNQNALYEAQQTAMKENADIAQSTATTIIQAAEAQRKKVEETTKSAVQGNIAYVKTLEGLRESVPDGSPLRAMIDTIINQAVKYLTDNGVASPQVPFTFGNGPGYTDPSKPYLAGRAQGGPVMPGQWYRVNETMDEYFRPKYPGDIISPQYNQQSSTSYDQSKTVKMENHFHNEVDPLSVSRDLAWEIG